MKGLIFMPDISGFTHFVKSMDIDLGMSITRDLLNEIIDQNPIDLDLSEIEGDAVLFYKIGKPIPFQQILSGFEQIFQAFDARFQKWKLQFSIPANLSLKLIVHYGEILVYDIKGFKKLYGETVIESHRLLKTESSTSDYILLTEDYLEALQQDVSSILSASSYKSCRSQLQAGAKKIVYYFLSTIRKASRLSLAQ